MVKIRLRRMGAKKAPFYRVVVADSRFPVTAASLRRSAPITPASTPLRSRSIWSAPRPGLRPAPSPPRLSEAC